MIAAYVSQSQAQLLFAILSTEKQGVCANHRQPQKLPSLASALGLLRNQASTAGNALNLRAAHLVVAPELEYAARKAVLDAGLSVAVAALAGLPAARWFLLPSTTTHPVIGLLRLAGEKSPVRLEKKDLFSVDGIAIRVSLDTGAAWLRRTADESGVLAATAAAVFHAGIAAEMIESGTPRGGADSLRGGHRLPASGRDAAPGLWLSRQWRTRLCSASGLACAAGAVG